MIYPDDGGTPIIRNIRSPTPHYMACYLLAPRSWMGWSYTSTSP